MRSLNLLRCLLALGASFSLTLAAQSPLMRFDRVVLPTSETSANVSFGDVNADGHLDVVLAI